MVSRVAKEAGFKTDPAYFSWLRGQIRKIWTRHPVKINFLKKNRREACATDKAILGSRVKWVYQCNRCKAHFAQKDIQVDHIKGGHSCNSIDKAKSFLEAIIMVGFDDLQILCKPCHKAKTKDERKRNS